MFRDECEIEVTAGKGGDGLVSFRREKYVPRGGPNGGNGGDGGSVILLATERVSSLLTIGRRPIYRAPNGRPGGTNDCTGARGAEQVLEVPIGTQVFDAKRGHLLRDLTRNQESVVVAAGGRGGRGNATYASSVRQAPRRADPGLPGEERRLRLELKLFAEVGLVGLPNAGKSTFLSVVSKATPKIADYPFTTLVPHVGIATLGDTATLVLADLPGLIEGAAEGAGLGHRFLKHVERCRVLLFLIDVSTTATTAPPQALATLEAELRRYSEELAGRPCILVATKVEDEAAEERARELEEAAGRPVRRISSVLGEGVEPLLAAAHALVHELG